MPVTAANALLRNGISRNQFYDPGFPEQNTDVLWNIGGNSGAYRLIGYATTIPGYVDATEADTSLIPQNRQQGLSRFPGPRLFRPGLNGLCYALQAGPEPYHSGGARGPVLIYRHSRAGRF